MATLATQPVALSAGALAHAAASVGGDVFTPAADTILHLINTGGAPVTVTVASQTAVIGEHVADVTLTVPAGGELVAGPFPHQFFASPSDGMAHITYSDAAHTQIAAVGMARGATATRSTLVTQAAAVPTSLPSSSVWITTANEAFVALSPSSPASGETVTADTTVPVSLPDGSLHFVHDGAGEATDLYYTPGMSAADLFAAASVPTVLAPNQIAVIIGADGVATDLYVGT